MSNAKDLLWPTDPKILVRFVFLYVGQGSSTIVLIRDNESYKSILVDINLDSKNGGVNVPELISDLLDGEKLNVFVNTHPHNDHLRGLIELSNKVKIDEIWHSNHKPSRNHDEGYSNLQKVIKKATRQVILKGSKEEQTFGEASYYVLSPAEYVTDEIEIKDPDERDRRIHEQCAVLKFGTASVWGMLPGDADRDAFEKHITEYHKEKLVSVLLAASHHGSRTFFRYDEEDDPYLDALNEIDPSHVIISAPKQSESKYDHPHEDAFEIYKNNVGEENVHHTGAERYCYIFDILEDGKSSDVENDNGELAKEYKIDGDDGGGDGGMAFTERKQKTYPRRSRYAL